VRNEACWIILNSISCGTEMQIEALVRAGAVRVLCQLLPEPSMSQMALEGLEKILAVCEALSKRAGERPAQRGSSEVAVPGKGGASSKPAKASLAALPSAAAGSNLVVLAGAITGAFASLGVVPPAQQAQGAAGAKPQPTLTSEDVMLADAKSLLESFRAELLERTQNGGALNWGAALADATAAVASGAGAASAKGGVSSSLTGHGGLSSKATEHAQRRVNKIWSA
jgi:hypothetical protein